MPVLGKLIRDWRGTTTQWLHCLAKSSRTLSMAAGLLATAAVASPGVADETTYASASPSQHVTDNHRMTPTVRAVQRAWPSVVNLHGQKTVRSTAAGMAGAMGGSGVRNVNGMGTGVVIDPRGYVITNYHVVEDVEKIQVTLHDGTKTTAELVASRPRSDLALVKINLNRDLPVVPRGTSSDLMVGETVIAIGNAYGYVHTTTQGIISALHRDVPVNDTQEYEDLIQISAGINPGNSGGPLLNIDGEIIGINVAVRVGAQQIAFAIPIDQAVQIVTSMIVEYNSDRLDTGLQTDGGPRDGDGITVTHVSASSPAAREGLKPGDRVVRIGSRSVDDRLDFALAMMSFRPGQRMPIGIRRGNEDMELAIATQVAVGGSVPSGVSDNAWTTVGIRVKPVTSSIMKRLNLRNGTDYVGGLHITSVRAGSTADRQGIQQGDILVGIHNWRTASMADLAGILDHPRIQGGGQAQFYLVRGNETLYGQFKLAARKSVARR